jgi:hypothetical protein
MRAGLMGRSLLGICILALSVASASCDESDPPSTPSPIWSGAITVESFSGTLPVGGTAFYSFVSPHTGVINLTLISLTENGQPSSNTVNLGLGAPSGTTCAVGVNSLTTGPGVSQHVSVAIPAGTYCARIQDVGNLTSAAAFSVNISHPAQ